MSLSYTRTFFQSHQEGSRNSARQVVPIILELVKPRKVIDVGCGLGSWLAVFLELGVETVRGIDGDYVNKEMLEIPTHLFAAKDLANSFEIEEYFDLVLSLEVAEHLPREAAEHFVRSLTRLGPVVVFAAAPPYQGGTGHVNEQWPDYWRDLFLRNDFLLVDALRKRIWNNENVEWWYRQNLLIFVEASHLQKRELLRYEYERTRGSQLALIHPEHYLQKVRLLTSLMPENQTVKQTLSRLPTMMKNAIVRRIKK